MYDYNETFTKSASQFADVAANVNRLALENAEKVFGLHFAAVETNINAAFAFANELVGVRDADVRRDRRQGHGVRPACQQQTTC